MKLIKLIWSTKSKITIRNSIIPLWKKKQKQETNKQKKQKQKKLKKSRVLYTFVANKMLGQF